MPHFGLAEIELLGGSAARATRHFEDGLRIAPDNAAAEGKLGALYVAGGRFGDARPRLERAESLGLNTAALYAARANLDPVVYEGVPKQEGGYVLPGGQLMLTTDVENYPGYPEGVMGPKMMEDFRKQALRFETRVEPRDVIKCDFSQRPFVLEIGRAHV